MIFTPTEKEFDGLMDSAEAFLDYIETHDDIDDTILLDLHQRITESVINIIGSSTHEDLAVEQRIRMSTDEFLAAAIEKEVSVCES